MKEKLYSILSVDDESSTPSKLYNYTNIGMTLVSLVPLMFNRQTDTHLTIEMIAMIFFILDYLLRWFTADIRYPEKSPLKAYLTHPFTVYAVIDVLAILPFLGVLDQTLRIFRLFRLFRSLRVFRVFHLFRSSKSLGILARTLQTQKESLMTVGVIVIAYLFIAALLLFNVEPDTFPTFLEALVWATSSLTTATYGDNYPISKVGQVLSIVSYLVGVGVVALPSSILTAGYIDELEKEEEMRKQENTTATDDD